MNHVLQVKRILKARSWANLGCLLKECACDKDILLPQLELLEKKGYIELVQMTSKCSDTCKSCTQKETVIYRWRG